MKLSFGPFFSGWKTKIGQTRLFSWKKKAKAALTGTDCLCLNLQEQEIRLAVVSSELSGNKQVSQFYSIPNQGLSEEGIAGSLQPLVAELSPKHPRLIGIISSGSVVTRNIEIPSRDPNEIREILGLQASRHTPYARDEIIIDYINLGVFKSVYTKVLLIIVPRKVVAQYYAIALRLNLQVDKIVFAPEATVRFIGKSLNLLTEKQPVCFVQMDATTSEFLIMSNGAVLFVRSIPVGAKHFETAREGYLIRFVAELRKSFDTYQSENIDVAPAKIIFTGATEGLEDLGASAQEAFNMSLKRVPDTSLLPLLPELKQKYEGKNVPLLATATPGILVDELTVDLSPEESKFQKVLADRAKQAIKAGILTMIIIGLLCFLAASRIYFKNVQLQELSKRYEPIRQEAESLEQTYARVQAVKTRLAVQGTALEALAELSSLVSDDIYLTEVKFEAGKKLDIKGASFAKPSIFALVEKMENSKIFKNVQTKYIMGRKEGDQEVSDFQIIASFK